MSGRPEARFGLPPEVRFCACCVISNQRPSSTVEYTHTRESKKETIGFDARGVCDACRFAEAKDTQVDWKDRERELLDLLTTYSSRAAVARTASTPRTCSSTNTA